MVNLYERALSGNEQLPFIKTFVRESIQCRTFLRVLYLVRKALAQVVQRLDNAIHRINRHPADKC